MPRKNKRHEIELKAKREAERQRQGRALRLATEADNEHRVLDFRQWCALNGFSLSTGRRILKGETGPVSVKLSERRIGVTVAANRAWLASLVRGAAA